MRFLPRFTFPIVSALFLMLLTIPLTAQETSTTIGLDTTESAILDSLQLLDTIQPQLRIGLFSGVNRSSAHVENLPLVPESKSGFHIGLRTEMEFAYPLYFLFETEYSQRGIHSNYETSGGAQIRETYKFSYLNFPILFRVGIPIDAKLDLSAAFGAVPSVLLSRTQSIRLEDADTTFSISKGVETFDFGLEYRLGLEYHLSPHHSLTVDTRYLHGLQNLLILVPTERDDRIWKNRNLSFSLGIMYQLQRSIR